MLRLYEHKDLKPHHRHIPPDFNADLFLGFEGTYGFLKKRFRYTLSDRFMCVIEAGHRGQSSTWDMPYKITGHVRVMTKA